ncbi:MAG: EH signature domain-containing protein [Methylococcaceae bacterium]
MNALNELQHKMAIKNEATIAALTRVLSGSKDILKPEIQALGEWSPKLPPASSPDRILVALREFIDNGFSSLSHARLLCNGCILSLGDSNYRLIEDTNRFINLLEYVGNYYKQTRPFRRCYRRLLNAYFLYDPQGAILKKNGVSNAEKLRHFLSEHQTDIKTPDFNPDWIAALADHKNLLTDNPCARYGLEALHGDRSAFNDICKRLEIIDTSWLIGRLVLSACDAAVEQNDDEFKDYVIPLISLLEEHPLYLNVGLGKLLNRYIESSDLSININLREFAVKFWGNPWLPQYKDNWQHCTKAARDMITGWLKRHLLREFFSILSQDEAANTRRVDFWELYCEDPQGMYFALGSAAYNQNNDRFKAFMDDAKGLCRVLNGGTKDLHGLIMQFNQFDVIEFSLQGNSTYFYATQHGKRPYNLQNSSIDIGSPSKGGEGLKAGGDNAPFSVRRRHADTGIDKSDKWEKEFAKVMGATSSAIQEFCRKYKCDHVPASLTGSNEWIMQTKSTKWGKLQFAVLFGWGFLWSVDKKGWYRAGN